MSSTAVTHQPLVMTTVAKAAASPRARWARSARRRDEVGQGEGGQDEIGLQVLRQEPESDQRRRQDDPAQAIGLDGVEEGRGAAHQQQRQQRVRVVVAEDQDGHRRERHDEPGDGGGRRPERATDRRIQDADGRDPGESLRQEEAPRAEPEDADRQAHEHRRQRRLVDGDEVRGIERPEEPGRPALARCLGRHRVVGVGPAADGEIPQVQHGRQPESPRGTPAGSTSAWSAGPKSRRVRRPRSWMSRSASTWIWGWVMAVMTPIVAARAEKPLRISRSRRPPCPRPTRPASRPASGPRRRSRATRTAGARVAWTRTRSQSAPPAFGRGVSEGVGQHGAGRAPPTVARRGLHVEEGEGGPDARHEHATDRLVAVPGDPAADVGAIEQGRPPHRSDQLVLVAVGLDEEPLDPVVIDLGRARRTSKALGSTGGSGRPVEQELRLRARARSRRRAACSRRRRGRWTRRRAAPGRRRRGAASTIAWASSRSAVAEDRRLVEIHVRPAREGDERAGSVHGGRCRTGAQHRLGMMAVGPPEVRRGRHRRRVLRGWSCCHAPRRVGATMARPCTDRPSRAAPVASGR